MQVLLAWVLYNHHSRNNDLLLMVIYAIPCLCWIILHGRFNWTYGVHWCSCIHAECCLRVCAAVNKARLMRCVCEMKIYLGNNLPPCVIINFLCRWQATTLLTITLPVTRLFSFWWAHCLKTFGLVSAYINNTFAKALTQVPITCSTISSFYHIIILSSYHLIISLIIIPYSCLDTHCLSQHSHHACACFCSHFEELLRCLCYRHVAGICSLPLL